MSAEKKVSRKQPAKNKRNSKSKQKLEFEKGKVYIPAYKMIVFCACVIAVCVTLLLISAIKAKDKNSLKSAESVKIEKTIKESEKEVPSVTKKQKNQNSEKTEKTEEKDKTKLKNQTEKTEKSSQSDKNENTPQVSKIEKTPQISKSEKTDKTVKKAPESVSIKPAQKKTETDSEIKPETKKDTKPAAETQKTEVKPVAPPVNPVKTEKKGYDFPKAVNNAQLVFLFDDGGQNLKHLQAFLELPFPITIAVLPQLPYSKESADRIRASGNELMLHQPMQAVDSNTNPGPGAIKPEMTEQEVISTLFYNINEIGPIAGFNNHEGSAITADAEKMEIILRVASENGIYFLDSRTNVNTKVPYVAKEMGYSYYERNGRFLDNEKTKENALAELRKNLDIANKDGNVIMIGHIWSADFLPEFLMEVYPELKEKGYTFTTVSKSNGRKN